MIAIAEAAAAATVTSVASKRGAWWDVLIPIVFGVILLGAVVAMLLAATVFAADPMAGT